MTKLTKRPTDNLATRQDHQEFTSIILSAKSLPCEAIIDKAFCEKYIKENNPD